MALDFHAFIILHTLVKFMGNTAAWFTTAHTQRRSITEKFEIETKKNGHVLLMRAYVTSIKSWLFYAFIEMKEFS